MALGIIDIVLLSVSFIASVLIGLYHGILGIKQTSMDYLLGDRMMKPLPLAISLTVGTVSAISIMGNAGEMYAHGTQLWVMDFGMALGMYVVAKLFIPILYPLKLISIYQFIESRFKSKFLRKCTVILTLLGGYLFTGFLLFPPSLFLQSFTGLSIDTNIVITGLLCSVYSSFGGVKAIVYTDVLQSFIMIFGSLAIVFHGSANVGGLSKVWDIAYHHERIEFFNFDLDPFQRHSFWLVIINGFFFSLSTYGVNQSQTQRAFSSGSIQDSQRVMYYSIVGMILFKGLINLSGLVIFANYVTCDPLTINPNKKNSNIVIVVHYVTQHLTKIPGLAGLFVASMYAAVLSSVSTQLNSMTALVWEDFLKNLRYFRNKNEYSGAKYQKILVMCTGVIGVSIGMFVSRINSYLKLLLQITGSLWGPMVGLFVVAIFFPSVKVQGASNGFTIAIILSLTIMIGQILTQPEATFLVMSHENCTTKIYITNLETKSNETLSSDIISTGNNTYTPKANLGSGFFGISYCLNYCWGTFTCIIISILYTELFSGRNTPDDVEEELIHPIAWQFFCHGFTKRTLQLLRNKNSQKIIEESPDKSNAKLYPNLEEMIPMGKH